MVLAELGEKISSALRKVNDVTIVDEGMWALKTSHSLTARARTNTDDERTLSDTIKSLVKDLQIALLQADVNVRMVKRLTNNIKNSVSSRDMESQLNTRKMIKKAVFDELVKMLDPDKKPYVPKKGKSNVIMFVGLQGNGKTTTIAKFAKYYRLKGWKVCMVCADTFRAGAFDQSKQNATRAKVPYYGSYEEADPVKIARDGVTLFRKEKQDLILVDTSGRHKQEESLFEEMKQLHDAIKPDNVVFVMDSTIGQAATAQAEAFRDAVDVGSCVITKLDGHAKGGGALSAVAATGSPITFIGTGEKFDDFERFDAKGFVKRMLGMGDVEGLVEKLRAADLLKQNPDAMERLKKGFWSLRDMKNQFESVMKMGPLDQVLSMFPGMNSNMLPKGADGQKRIQKFMCMLDSMTDAELDGLVSLDPNSSRATRVARGSGTILEEVGLLLHYHKKMQKMVGKLGKTNFMKNDSAISQQYQRNPKQLMSTLAKSIDPKMLKQMGGAQNLMKMMKSFEGSESMSELQKMMGNMKGGGRMRRRR